MHFSCKRRDALARRLDRIPDLILCGRCKPLRRAARCSALCLCVPARVRTVRGCWRAPIPVPSYDPAVLMNLGGALRDLGRLEEALDQYTHVTRVQPDYAPAFRARGMMLVMLGRAEEALEVARAGRSAPPGRCRCKLRLGRGTRRGWPQTVCVAALRPGRIALDPAHGHAHHNRAILLAGSGQPTEALASYDRALALQPQQCRGS